MMIRKKLKETLSKLLLIFAFTSVFYQSVLYNSEPKLPKLNEDTNSRLSVADDNQCEPILKDAKQFYVNIDGEIYPKLVPSYSNKSINFDCLNRKKEVKKILLWNDFGPWADFKYGLGRVKPFKDRKCPVYNCEMTRNKSELNSSDLVIVHMRGNFKSMPTRYQGIDQPRWVFFMMEPPVYSLVPQMKRFNGAFNLTATYKLDSYFTPYYYANLGFEWALNDTFDDDFDYLAGKTVDKLAVILVSHCKTHSERLKYVKKMEKHSKGVRIYGNCGQSCNLKGENRYLSKQCREKLSNEYMFFLAFENSFCEDYVTEKLFDSLLFDSIPIVYGLADYAKWLPKSAYINALDFQSPKHLVDYLIYLSQNKTAYNSYFKWKKYIRFTDNEYKSFCDMCIKLHLEDYFGVKQSVVEDLDWDSVGKCKSPVFEKDRFHLAPINKTVKCDIC